MKTTKRCFSVILAITLVLSLGSFCFAKSTTAKLLNIYADGMLFLQNSDAVICGTGVPEGVVTLSLFDSDSNLIEESSAVISTDGTFNISFHTPNGSFSEYTIILKENGKQFTSLNNVVFGELWLASGQSNMQYPLSQSKTGQDMFKNKAKLNKWLRVLLVPPYPEYNSSTSLVPAYPQNDLSDAIWVNGENTDIYNMSAVAYFFAEELMKNLNMPIGILNSSLGGSSIRSWLSREAIDGNSELKNYLLSRNEYFTLSDWNEAEQSVYYDMTANFNQKIYPLRNFRLSGMIWYQGETDLMTGNTEYETAIDLLQESYTKLFNYDDGLLPLIFTQLAAYNYSADGELLNEWNYEFTKMQENHAESRALVTIYDVPLTYLPEAGLIHPERKEEVGQRMAFCADGLIYSKKSSYTAPTVKNVEILNDEIFITFKNIGNSLFIKGTKAYGFAICSDDGLYVNAEAEIVSANTIKVYSENIKNPKAVTYAFGVANQNANLYASENNIPTLPVAPFITNLNYTEKIWLNKSWCDCDDALTWHTEDDSFSGYYDTWESKNSVISYSISDSVDSTKGLNISSDKISFYISPVTTYKDKLTEKVFTDSETNYSKYGSISFYIRNNSEKEVTFDGLRFYKNPILWYAPEITGTLDTDITIPADGEWHYISLNLNKLYHLGNECSLSYSSEKLENIENIRIYFSSPLCSESNISIDSFSFAPSNENNTVSYDVNIKNADNLIELLTAIVLTIVGRFAQFFKNI